MARLQTFVSLLMLGSAPRVLGQVTGNESDLAPVTSMDTGSFHTVVIIRDSGVNVVKDWGANGKGQLGLNGTKDRGDTDGGVGDLLPEVNIGNGMQATHITAGLRHTAAILNDNTVRAWGYNAKGQLGVGTNESVGDKNDQMGDNMVPTDLGETVAIDISAGGWHTCAIMEGDQLKCWGYNQWGELGLEDKEDRGDGPNEMGDNLPFVDLGDNVDVQAISLGDWHTCVLLTSGEVTCFGKNFAGQLGLGDTEHRGDQVGEMGNNLRRVFLGGKKATSVACGEEHTCAILEDGELRCWGLGASGQLGQGNRQNLGDDGGEMEGMVGIDLGTGRTAIQVAAGGNHTCALLDNNDVKCWGENTFGELGQGDTFYRGIAPEQMGDSLEPIEFNSGWTISYLSVGYYHSCALVDPDDSVSSVLCWGANFNGQLGLGLTESENIGDNEGEMGESLELADLGGNYMDESEANFYSKTWFYIAVAAAAAYCCCFCILVYRSHADDGGRGSRHYASQKMDMSPSTVGDSSTIKSATTMSGGVGRPLGGMARGVGARSRKVASEEEVEAGTATGSPSGDTVAPTAEGTKA